MQLIFTEVTDIIAAKGAENMKLENTLETERLILRQFTRDDVDALFAIYADPVVNTFLPWFPLESREAAEKLFEEKYANPRGYFYAVCLKENNIPIGYVHAELEDGNDLGYGLRKEFWHQGLVTEATRAVVERLKQDSVPFITATHDVNNPRSGGVMENLGMRYQYSYREQWQPKDIFVVFRMYQLNLDGREDRVYREYWNRYEEHFVEDLGGNKK